MTLSESIMDIVRGNLAWSDPMSTVCLDQHERHPEKFPKGSSFQTEDESLADIIRDLTLLQNELRIESSFQSAQL